MELSDYLQTISYDIAFWMAGLNDPEFPLGQVGDVCVDVTHKLRAAAIIALLAKADADTFFHNLIRSARCRVLYLTRLREANWSHDHHQASGRIDPFLDAVAAEDFVTARQIAVLSPSNWLDQHEYEDDYCYAQIVHALIAAPGTSADITPLLDRFELVSQGQPHARVPVVRALATRDREGFDPAFEDLISQRTAQIEADKARHKLEDPTVIAERQVYIEGLALLRIASRIGLKPQAEYLYCPSIARGAMQRPFPGE